MYSQQTLSGCFPFDSPAEGELVRAGGFRGSLGVTRCLLARAHPSCQYPKNYLPLSRQPEKDRWRHQQRERHGQDHAANDGDGQRLQHL